MKLWKVLREEEMKTLAAIPCYNEAVAIGSVVLRAKNYVDEVLVLDDGSTDRTAKVAEEAGAEVVRHGGNMGYGAAIRSIFEHSKENGVDALVVLDGDGQHDPGDIPDILKCVVEEEVDICIGSRFLDEGDKSKIPKYRQFGINVLTWLTNIGSNRGVKTKDSQSGFRGYSRRAIEMINPRDEGMGVSAEILMEANAHGLRVKEIPICCRYDVDSSTQNPVGHGWSVIGSIIRYMEIKHPLLFFGLPGFILAIAGLAIGVNEYLYFEAFNYIRLGPTLMALFLFLVGTLAGMTGLILHAVINAAQRGWR